ncbi:MAG: hypothetical protein NFCOHLIN_00001 [Gammaproteobacteria bacterium]|nr:hypothetical protein [Gammaproteobacteria bacterium]
MGRRLAAAPGRQPGRGRQHCGGAEHQRPHAGHRPGVHQRVESEQEPVEDEHRRCLRQMRRTALAHDRLHQRQQHQHRRHADGDRPWRLGAGLGHALHVHPHQQQREQRHADVDEHQQREQPVADAVVVNEIAHQFASEAGQPVQPLEARLGDELRQAVPGKHEAVGAGREYQPHQYDACHPREPAESAHAIEGPVAHQVDQHRDDHRVRCVAVHAAEDAAGVTLGMRQRLHRAVSPFDARVEEGIEVQPGAGDDPEQIERQRAQVIQGIELVAEGAVEHRLGMHEARAQQALRPWSHRALPARQTTIRNSSPPRIATAPPTPISPMPKTSPGLRSTCSAPATLRCTP